MGNIYKGRVENVLRRHGRRLRRHRPGAQRLPVRGRGGRRRTRAADRSRKITDLLKAGKELLVQVTRDPWAARARGSPRSWASPGRYVVYLPGRQRARGVAPADDAERERLRARLPGAAARDRRA